MVMDLTRYTSESPPRTLPEHGILLYESQHGAGFKLEEHRHPFYELFIFIGGAGRVVLDGHPHPVSEGSIALVGANVPHWLEDDPREPLNLFVVAFRPEAVQYHPEFALLLQPLQGPGAALPDTVALTGAMDLVRRILHEQERQQPGWTIAIRSALSELLLQLVRIWLTSVGVSPARQAEQDDRLEDLRRYLEENYYNRLNVDTLASRIHLSSRQVSHLFKKRYGLTLMEYLARVRVERAKGLLAHSSKEIVAICFEVGYENLSHFYRVFKSATGLSPKRYREQARGYGQDGLTANPN